jgi:L-fuconolactonase
MEETAAASDLIAAITPYADLENPTLEEQLDGWQRNPKFRGVRARFEGHPDPDILARPGIVEGLHKLAERGLVFEFLVRSHHLKHILKVYERTPELKGVIEHLAKPDMIEGSDSAEWHQQMEALARNTNVACKLSLSPQGEQIADLLANPGRGWSVENIKPYVQFLLESYGCSRLMWGSDWPVALLTAGYTTTYQAMREAIGPLDPADELSLFRNTAVRFYELPGAEIA